MNSELDPIEDGQNKTSHRLLSKHLHTSVPNHDVTYRGESTKNVGG